MMESVIDTPLQIEETKSPTFQDEPLLSFIVPIYKIQPDTLKRCLLSLQEQDYEQIEVICVLDGPDPELKKVAYSFSVKEPEKFKCFEIEHAGACAARNAGFKKSKGDVVSFFNSDYVLKRGMARLWIDRLLEHKECGFVYGGYEYSSGQRWWYPSKPFDPWLLEVSNYIDCGFPLWRKYVVDWDTDCKSLQDWDFWIRVIKTHHVKGYYLGRDVSFIAEPPRKGGLSLDSHENWTARVTYIKEKNHIPLRDIVVTSLGAPNHGVEIAKMIGADYRDDTLFKPSNYKALYLIGFFMKPDDPVNDHSKIIAHFKDNYPKAKRVVHFVGADIYWLRKFPYESLKYLAGALKLSVDHILCETPYAQKELAELGILAEIVPIPSYSEWELKPLPDQFRVAIFLTDRSDFDKYCKEETLSIVRAMPDVKFASYGDGDHDIRYQNLQAFGVLPRREWERFVYANSALLRMVRHDTLPMSGCEFLMAGRDVVTNIPMFHAEQIDTSGKSELNEFDIFQEGLNAFHWPDTKKRIVQKIRSLRSTSKDFRVVTSKFYQNLLDKERYFNTMKDMFYGPPD